ncbi:semaphorin-4A [Alligator mississippiensis]|uniref:Semaphorin-4A n=1 Tax=Alligator mississippiensis TaxID=8496 RepID=A0A151NYG3_ALLMI|nr:semaphorin-4A [Alligator mississippiensis]XP_059574049.1 semaphorin-4A [Alligator mississippiensis]KYO41793.1 semaphorin-4A [Alligator mississippiensis]
MHARALCLLWGLAISTAALGPDPAPRVAFQWGDPRRILPHFSLRGVSNYDVLLLSKDEDTLYVGARDTILSLGVDSTGTMAFKNLIPWAPTDEKKQECVFKKKSNLTECFNFIRVLVPLNQTHLYVCGTYAFSPTCSYVSLDTFTLVSGAQGQPLLLDGKGQSPFNPQHTYTAALVDGELYTGTMNNFQGNEPIISRALSNRTLLKTDAFLRWLQADAAFVASFSIPHDDKVYFFFEETANEFDFFEGLTVPRVAQVCKSDVGGDKVLQRKWTTFLKAQLSCAQPERFPYNVIHHAVALPQPAGGTVFYGVFSSQWEMGATGGAAVCAFSQPAIKEVFNGKYKELNKGSLRWTTYSEPVMVPRPGSCSVGPSSDKTLNFMKEHFLMDGKVEPMGLRPLLEKQDVTYTRLAVHQVPSISGTQYPVLFLGTDQGLLHKAVVLPGGTHIIEEIQLFQEPEAVRNLLLSPAKGMLYVGFARGVLQVPVANCSLYQSCADCILARDPFCAWDSLSHACRETRAGANVTHWLQDVEMGFPNDTCPQSRPKGRAIGRSQDGVDSNVMKTLSPAPNTVLRLPCPRLSALANYNWRYPEQRPSEGVAVLADQTLVLIAQNRTAGTYECWASENGYSRPVARYVVQQPRGGAGHPGYHSRVDGIAEEGVEPLSPHRSYWPQFVTVTVLLAVTLVGAVAVALVSYHDRLKAKSKVQGCSSPPATKASQQEKVPLSGAGGDFQFPTSYQDGACCLQMDGISQAIDADNNRLSAGPGLMDGAPGAAAGKA